MPRILLLSPTTSYRTGAFLDAAARVDVDVTVASEQLNALAHLNPSGLLTLDFDDAEIAADQAARFAEHFPIDAVVPVDSQATVAAAVICQKLGLRHNSVRSVVAAQDKHRMRQLMQNAKVPIPDFQLCSLDAEPTAIGRQLDYPVVVKPLHLAASQGVIRADDTEQFVQATKRLAGILQQARCESEGQRGHAAARSRRPDAANDEHGTYLVERYVEGPEVALEGLLSRGTLRVLALFDKPDPLVGPFFAETIYVTPSGLSTTTQREIATIAAEAARAIGLTEGPIHAELRISREGPQVIEVNARSIGGHCSKVLRFGGGMGLEELIIRHALAEDFVPPDRESQPAGVMMIPVPQAGVFRQVLGLEEARAVCGIDDVVITVHPGQSLVPLPEGASYVGFIFARANSPESVDTALRQARACLTIIQNDV